MEILQLRYFCESAMTESFSKTAQKYMVPASSVSASVRRLEQEIGTELFIRTGNRITLNENGKRFFEMVNNTLTQLNVAVNTISQQFAQKQTISVLARCTRETLVLWTVRFYRQYPSVSFQFAFDDRPENYDNYDIIVSSPTDGLEDYASFLWRKFLIRVEVLDTDPLCRGPVTLRQLCDRAYVTTNSQRGAFQVFAKACERQGFSPKVFLECDDYDCRTIALKSGLCLGLNLASQNEASRTGGMQFLTVTDFNEELTINVYYKKEKYEGKVKSFLDLLESAAPK